MSNGRFMSGSLACDSSDKIVAVGILAASLCPNTAAACKPAKPVSALIIQGTKDPLVPFEGGALGKNGDRGEVLSHDASGEIRRTESLLGHTTKEANCGHCRGWNFA